MIFPPDYTKLTYGPFPAEHPISRLDRFEAALHARGGAVVVVKLRDYVEIDAICTWLEETLGSNLDLDPDGRWFATTVTQHTHFLTSFLTAFAFIMPGDEVIFRLRWSEIILSRDRVWSLADYTARLERSADPTPRTPVRRGFLE